MRPIMHGRATGRWPGRQMPDVSCPVSDSTVFKPVWVQAGRHYHILSILMYTEQCTYVV